MVALQLLSTPTEQSITAGEGMASAPASLTQAPTWRKNVGRCETLLCASVGVSVEAACACVRAHVCVPVWVILCVGLCDTVRIEHHSTTDH